MSLPELVATPTTSTTAIEAVDSWLTVPECAARAKACAATIRRAIGSRQLRATRVGLTYRIRITWLDDWLERQATPRALSPEAREAVRVRCTRAVQARWRKARSVA